jgi:DNA-directed RNA polymerase subunit N (RpoN/RPB10)
MPIPIRCMNCGNVLSDLWRYYQKRTKELRGGLSAGGQSASLLILDETKLPKTAEGQVLDELVLHRYCCRKELLTYRETY